MNKILLVGCGHMGSALLGSWLKKTSNHYTIVDPKQHIKLSKKFKKRVHAFENIEKVKDTNKFDIIIFAIKPQNANLVINKFIKLRYKKNVLFISIIAGKKISFYNNFLPLKNQFVRVMPNMSATIEESMSCLVANKFVSEKNKNKVHFLFSRVGKVLWLRTENELEKVTAISGSGPAYFFLFIELMEKATVKLGFKRMIAKQLVYQTALGSIQLLMKNVKSAEQLRKSIAISGGTTEAAIKILKQKNEFKTILNRAIKAAHKKAIELGNK